MAQVTLRHTPNVVRLTTANDWDVPERHRRCCFRNAVSSRRRCTRAPCRRDLPPAAASYLSECGTARARPLAAMRDVSHRADESDKSRAQLPGRTLGREPLASSYWWN